jgi:hypothetical protein
MTKSGASSVDELTTTPKTKDHETLSHVCFPDENIRKYEVVEIPERPRPTNQICTSHMQRIGAEGSANLQSVVCIATTPRPKASDVWGNVWGISQAIVVGLTALQS